MSLTIDNFRAPGNTPNSKVQIMICTRSFTKSSAQPFKRLKKHCVKLCRMTILQRPHRIENLYLWSGKKEHRSGSLCNNCCRQRINLRLDIVNRAFLILHSLCHFSKKIVNVSASKFGFLCRFSISFSITTSLNGLVTLSGVNALITR